ncbi:MAG: DUF4097 family beta strand repeat protein [Clostridia bacterium]|nr:DUF4097 family beta strand repeat protein [Clostridia bacterium]
MKKSTKIWLIVATILSLAGLLMFAVTMAAGGWDFSRLNSVKFVSNTHCITEDFTNIYIDTDTADVSLVRSENDECKVVLREALNEKHTVTTEDGTLKISIKDNRKWYEHITFFSFSLPKITIYLPENVYGALTVKQDTGDITLPSAFTFESVDLSGSTGDARLSSTVTGPVRIERSTGDVEVQSTKVSALALITSTGDVDVTSVDCDGKIYVSVSTGDVEMENVSCETLTSTGSTGEITLENVTVSGQINIKRSTGDVEFEHSDAAEIYVITDTGDVRGSLKTSKIFFTETDTGDVSVPRSTEGGICDIRTDTGDIKMTIK